MNQEAECEKEKMDVAYQAQTNIADSSREYQMQKASYDQEVNARKAEAELSYELQVKKTSGTVLSSRKSTVYQIF